MSHLATAAEVRHAGQSTRWAAARLWGRRLLIAPVAAVAVATMATATVVMLYEWFTQED